MRLTLHTSADIHRQQRPEPVAPVSPMVPVSQRVSLPQPATGPQRTLHDLCDAYLAETRLDHASSTHYQRRVFCAAVLRDLLPLPLEDITADPYGQKTHAASRV